MYCGYSFLVFVEVFLFVNFVIRIYGSLFLLENFPVVVILFSECGFQAKCLLPDCFRACWGARCPFIGSAVDGAL